MIITLKHPLCFSEIGRKDNQEDYLFPNSNVTAADKVFILCDGMGGHANGEVASSTVAEAMGAYLNSCGAKVMTKTVFDNALSYAYSMLDAKDGGEESKMGTTMTSVCFHDNGVLVAHIGDSRIYQIRPSLASEERTGIIYQSSDHSLVNDLLKAGQITAEEAKDFPQKNIITRAMQPNMEHRSKADVFLLSDVEPGDYFFMCCDGVLEQLTNERLAQILSSPDISDEEKMRLIKAECDGNTKDNYTAWLLHVDSVEGKEEAGENSDEVVADVDEAEFPEPDVDEGNDENEDDENEDEGEEDEVDENEEDDEEEDEDDENEEGSEEEDFIDKTVAFLREYKVLLAVSLLIVILATIGGIELSKIIKKNKVAEPSVQELVQPDLQGVKDSGQPPVKKSKEDRKRI